jgi:Glycosyl transferase family 2
MFSVALCTYNGARHVGEQLASFAAQTRPPGELVVCDDRSTDETVRVVEEFAASASFPVRLFVNERNLGSTKNFGRAIELCECELIALSDQDDVWLPSKLERLEDEFVRAPGALAVFSDATVADEELRPTGRGLWESVRISPGELVRVGAGRGVGDLLRGSTVTGATLAFRARLRELALPVPTDLPLIHDAWLALLAACAGGVRPVAEPLVLYRQHGAQQVGALARNEAAGGLDALAAGAALDALNRANPYDSALAVARAARARLAESRARGLSLATGPRVASALAELDARIEHMEARRALLPRARLRRAPSVLKELLTLRYHRYSNGVASAAKDLLA